MGFVKGDIVVCVDNSNSNGFIQPLTIGGYYVAGQSGSDYCMIINDLGNTVLYSHNRFLSVIEYRSNIINNILE